MSTTEPPDPLKNFDFTLKVPPDQVDSILMSTNLGIFATAKTIQIQMSEIISVLKNADLKETILRHEKFWEETKTLYLTHFVKVANQ